MTNLLTPSIEKRATEYILNGMDVLEAVKLAIETENNMILSLLGSGFLSGKGKKVSNVISDSVYNRINNKD